MTTIIYLLTPNPVGDEVTLIKKIYMANISCLDESILDIALVKGLYLSRIYYALVFTTHSRIVTTPSTMMYEFICSEFKG